jgi:membrane fusion protein, multidrug efflux system
MASSNQPGRRFRRAWLVGAVLLVLVVVVVVAFRPWDRGAAPEPPPRDRAVAVEVVEVRGATLQQTVRGIGTLRASATVVLRPEVAGVVRAIRFAEGARIERGQVLFELQDDTLVRQQAAREAALRSAESAVAEARRNLERMQLLWDRELIARVELERAQTEVDRWVAEVDRLRADLQVVQSQRRETRVRAPFTGVVSEREVDRGAYVNAGEALATLYQVDPLELEFYLPERHVVDVRRGQDVAVTIAAHPDRAFRGQVDFVAPAVREATRDFLVKATLPNADGLLRPGAFAMALVTVDVRAERPVIPEEALVATRLGYLVFTVDEGVARAREVRIGLRQAGQVEVVEGLEVGDVVVRAGHLRLSGGETVRVVEGGAPAVGQEGRPPAASPAGAEAPERSAP